MDDPDQVFNLTVQRVILATLHALHRLDHEAQVVLLFRFRSVAELISQWGDRLDAPGTRKLLDELLVVLDYVVGELARTRELTEPYASKVAALGAARNGLMSERRRWGCDDRD